MRSRLPCSSIMTVALLCAAPSPAQSPDPRAAIERELAEPFSYFLVPSDVLGFKDAPEGTQVTHDGAFNTGFGEFDLFVGRTPTRVNQRIKTLLDGHLPILHYGVTHDGLHYDVEAFAAPLELSPFDLLVNFIRVTVSNPGARPASGGLGVAFVALHGTGRHPLTCVPWYRAQFMDRERLAAGPISFQQHAAWRKWPPGLHMPR